MRFPSRRLTATSIADDKQTFEAAAVRGDGVFPTLRSICKSVMGRL